MDHVSREELDWRVGLVDGTRRFQPPVFLMGWLLFKLEQLHYLWGCGEWRACQGVWDDLSIILDELAWRPEVLPTWSDTLADVGMPGDLCMDFRAKIYRRHWQLVPLR